MRVRGIHYDVGTASIEGTSARPTPTRARIASELHDIRDGLHATAVGVARGEAKSLASAVESLRRAGATGGLVIGLEPSVFMAGILPAAAHGGRGAGRAGS